MTDMNDHHNKLQLEQALEEYIELQIQGYTPDIEEFIKQCPEIKEPLRSRINTLNNIDNLLSSLVEVKEEPDSISPDNLIGKTLGDFEIIKEIGRGGMGVVFLAKQISLDREIALKVISNLGGNKGRDIER